MIAPGRRPARVWPWTCGVILVAGWLCATFVRQERIFPYWDAAIYHNLTLALTDAFTRSPADGLHELRESLPEDYNSLFALPLVPGIMVAGERRLAFVLLVFVVYFIPYLLAGAWLARGLLPQHPQRSMLAGAVFIVATPACWYHVALGYPDIGGAALIAGCVLLYGRWRRSGRLRTLMLMGLLAGLAIVFRRHYVYAVAALFAAVLADVGVGALAQRGSARGRARAAAEWIGSVVLAAAVGWLTIRLILPSFFRQALASSSGRFAGWQQSVTDTMYSMVGTVGAVPLGLAAIGWLTVCLRGGGARAEFRILLMGTTAWAAAWSLHARQQPYHYPHWLPLFVALGLAALWLALREVSRRSLRLGGAVVMALLVFVGLVTGVPLAIPVATARALPRRLFPDPIAPRVNPAYDEVARLVTHLREIARPDDAILVAASSHALNFDIVRGAERTLYGRGGARLKVQQFAQVDSLGKLPTSLLLGAAIVVVAIPFQHHLAPDQQKVVRVLLDAVSGSWPIAADFELLPDRFTLGTPGTEVRLYRRVRPSSPEVSGDTTRRINQFVHGTPLDAPRWVLRSSPYPAEVTEEEAGRFRITAHPPRASEGARTVVELLGLRADRVRLTGWLSFFDERCAGVALLAGVGMEEPTVTLGAFAPGIGTEPFDAVVRRAAAGQVYLDLRAAPREPERIDFCTVLISELEAIPGG